MFPYAASVIDDMLNRTYEQQDLILSYPNLLSFPLSKFVLRKPNRKFEALQYLASLNLKLKLELVSKNFKRKKR